LEGGQFFIGRSNFLCGLVDVFIAVSKQFLKLCQVDHANLADHLQMKI
jgi:hypothetical protein